MIESDKLQHANFEKPAKKQIEHVAAENQNSRNHRTEKEGIGGIDTHLKFVLEIHSTKFHSLSLHPQNTKGINPGFQV